MADEQWYYCLDHKVVEQHEQCNSDNRLGPYASQVDAEQALKGVENRNEAWDKDPRFNDEDPEEDEERTRFDGAPID